MAGRGEMGGGGAVMHVWVGILSKTIIVIEFGLESFPKLLL